MNTGPIIGLLVLIGIILTVWIAAEVRLQQYQERIHELECRHVLYEDGSSLHKDAEAVRRCLR